MVKHMNNELYHWSKGKQKPNHKYYKREWRDGRWLYWYNKKDYIKDHQDAANIEADIQDTYKKDAYENDIAAIVDNLIAMDYAKADSYSPSSSGKGHMTSSNKKMHEMYKSEAKMHKTVAAADRLNAEYYGNRAEKDARNAARTITNSKKYKAKEYVKKYKRKGIAIVYKYLGINLAKVNTQSDTKKRPVSRKKKVTGSSQLNATER